MIYASIAFFAVAAVFGILNLKDVVASKKIPRGVVYSHGAFAVAAFILLIVYAVQHPDHYPMVSLVLFAAAAVGGLYLFFRDVTTDKVPVVISFVHGLLAVVAFITLLLFVFS